MGFTGAGGAVLGVMLVVCGVLGASRSDDDERRAKSRAEVEELTEILGIDEEKAGEIVRMAEDLLDLWALKEMKARGAETAAIEERLRARGLDVDDLPPSPEEILAKRQAERAAREAAEAEAARKAMEAEAARRAALFSSLDRLGQDREDGEDGQGAEAAGYDHGYDDEDDDEPFTPAQRIDRVEVEEDDDLAALADSLPPADEPTGGGQPAKP